jgi:hypothetical protein
MLAGGMFRGEIMFNFISEVVADVVPPDDPATHQWRLFMLSTIVETQPEAFIKRMQQVTEFLLAVATDEDEQVIVYGSRFISTLAEFVGPALTSVADELCGWIMEKIEAGVIVPDLFTALEQLLGAIERPPGAFGALKDAFVALCQGSDQAPTFVVALASLLQKLQAPQEELHAGLAPIVDEWLQGDAPECGLRLLSGLVVAAPESVKAGLEGLVDGLLQMLGAENWTIRAEAVRCLRQFAGYYAQAMSGGVADVLRAVFGAIPEDGSGRQEDDDPMYETVQSMYFTEAMLCVAEFIRWCPAHAAPAVDGFFEQIARQREANGRQPGTPCDAIAIAAPGLKALGRLEFVEVVQQVIKQLGGPINFKSIIAIHRALFRTIEVLSADVASDGQLCHDIYMRLSHGIALRYTPEYLPVAYATDIDFRLLEPIFSALMRFVKLVDWSQFDLESIVDSLDNMLEKPLEIGQGYAIETLARLANISPEYTPTPSKPPQPI